MSPPDLATQRQHLGDPVETDVVVIGGGPAGSTAAALLARAGWRVAMLEKSAHPRFHVGESLLPMNLPILERLGVLDEVRAIGVHKNGADFPANHARDANRVFRFSDALGARHDHAFQVRRDQFDALLFGHARAQGVDAREHMLVESVEFEDGRPRAVVARGPDGMEARFRMRYLVDASGRDTFLGRKLGLKRKDARHQSAAVFSHFRGVRRGDGEHAGNITVARFPQGWLWMIPLPGDVMSIGAVCAPDVLRQRARADTNAGAPRDQGAFLDAILASVPAVRERMAGASRIAPVHVTGNYSYACQRMAGPGWVMAGDAYAFIDPVFSSGVFLGMDGAERAAAVVDGTLRDPAREAELQRAMSRRMERGLRHFSWFIHRFTSPVMQHLFAHPRNIWQVEQAVISMLAGDVFDNRAVLRRLMLFRLFYAATAIAMAPRALRARLARRRQARALFAGDTLQEGNP